MRAHTHTHKITVHNLFITYYEHTCQMMQGEETKKYSQEGVWDIAEEER